MGGPVKIVELARNLIKLSGYTEDDIPVEFTGIRPGEKMYEELLGEDEIDPGEVNEKIYVGRTMEVDSKQVAQMMGEVANMTEEQLKKRVMWTSYGADKVWAI